MVDGCRPLLAALQRPRAPLEVLFDKCRTLFCGTLPTQGGERAHPHKNKIINLTGMLAAGVLQAGVYALVELWDRRFDTFFRVCKSPSRFGGFAQPHVRHMLAEQVALDTVFYKDAKADPVRASKAPHPRLSGECGLCACAGGG